MNVYGKIGLFLGGVLFGSAGFQLLGSRDAKKVYAHAAAACFRCRDHVMEQIEDLQNNCDDILSDAKAINETRAENSAQAVIEDTSAESGD